MGFFAKMIQAQLKANLQEAKKKQQAAAREQKGKQELANKIKEQAREQSKQWLKIVNDCADLVNTTKKPDVFFNRYNLMLEYLEKLAGLECTGIFENFKELPSATFLRIEAQFPAATNDFIDRSFSEAQEKAEALKTEKGKANAMQRYFDNMEQYIIHMDGESIEYLDNLKQKHLSQ